MMNQKYFRSKLEFNLTFYYKVDNLTKNLVPFRVNYNIKIFNK